MFALFAATGGPVRDLGSALASAIVAPMTSETAPPQPSLEASTESDPPYPVPSSPPGPCAGPALEESLASVPPSLTIMYHSSMV